MNLTSRLHVVLRLAMCVAIPLLVVRPLPVIRTGMMLPFSAFAILFRCPLCRPLPLAILFLAWQGFLVCFTNFPVNDSIVLLQFVNLNVKVFCCIYINSVVLLTRSANCFFQIYFDLHEFRNNNTWGNLLHCAHIWKVLMGLCKRSHDCGLFEEQSP